ncbi:hypothetical protein DPEC_G00244640 [Dallia pectoralis]|uniref:Uncharacterized protein n=1 Tax=Dallia pectoralis TaxID=75939 RepID=A0ACC2FW30_DALPE|nr:hypothetical protein DPEC_G00244640 [Dallia pectoralis]
MELLGTWCKVLCFLVLPDLLVTLPISEEQGPRPEDIELAERYLQKFFYLRPSGDPRPRNSRATSASNLEERIREMQDFFGLKPTGNLDLQTLNVMRKDRCGVPDVENYSLYPNQPKWRNHTISYRIANYTPDLTRQEVDTSVHLALKIWSDMAPVKFIRVNHFEADIVFSFARKTHEDFFPFDGPNGVLAHAFKPGEDMGGDVHFDEDEIWTMGRSKPGHNLFTVAAHEIGHSLGLSHSKDPLSLMYPNYKYYNGTKYILPQDDVLGIQELYGTFKPGNYTSCYMWLRPTWTSYWKPLREGPINTYLPCINTHVDAAYDIPAKGLSFDEYRRRIDPGFPRNIQEDWQGIGKTVDAAFELQGTIYLFSDTKAYHYDYIQNQVLNTTTANSWLGC